MKQKNKEKKRRRKKKKEQKKCIVVSRVCFLELTSIPKQCEVICICNLEINLKVFLLRVILAPSGREEQRS